jgi:cytochrome d ubiquinol oxidase subunit II
MGTRAAAAGRLAALVLLAAFTLAGIWIAADIDGFVLAGAVDPNGPSNPLRKTVAIVGGAWLGNFRAHPALWLAPGIAYLGIAATWLTLRAGRHGLAFVASSVAGAGVVSTGGIALFPFLLPSSTMPNASLTVWDASSSRLTLFIMLIATAFFLPIVIAYTAWVFRVLRGAVTLAHLREEENSY